MTENLKRLSCCTMAAVALGCSGDAAGPSNAPPSVQKADPATAAEKPVPTSSKSPGSDGPLGEEARGALK